MDVKLLGRGKDEVVVSSQQHGGSNTSDTESQKAGRLSLSDGTTVISSALTVAVTVRRGRVFALLVAMLVVILGIMFIFMKGVEVSRFEASTRDSASRETLLNDYNSYSGIIASAFAKPIEIAITALAQIITLRFLAQAFTQPDTTWKQSSLKLVLSVSVGYLVSNGFNALNVQLRMQEVRPAISPTDLSAATQSNELFTNDPTLVPKTVPELTPGNLVSNTVLRSAVVNRLASHKDICRWSSTRWETLKQPPPQPVVNFGFSRRDWQSRVLQKALQPQAMRFIVNATNTSVNDGVQSSDLPMNASLAADLFVYFMNVAPKFFPWGDDRGYFDQTQSEARFPVTENLLKKPFSQIVGLLPPSDASTETEKRDWFFDAFPTAVTRQFKSSKNTSLADIGVEFSHIDITPAIKFDAVTFEVDVIPKEIPQTTQARGKATRNTEVWRSIAAGALANCSPWSAMCLVEKPKYIKNELSSSTPSEYALDQPQLVQVFSSCATADGRTELAAKNVSGYVVNCENASDTSVMVLSIGRRFIADAIATTKNNKANITNLRFVYTFTVGRLSWELENLSEVFHADCLAGSSGLSSKCLGLQIPLSDASVSGDSVAATPQHLVVSADALPTSLIIPSSEINAMKPRGINLVEVVQYPFAGPAFGEVLLPHNIQKIDWEPDNVENSCDADIEAGVFARVSNHLYIEHSFQVAYTAATFFLLQDGVVKDTISLSQDKMTLSFDRNTQDIVVWVSTPFQNALLTILGCAVLVICLSASVFQSMCCMPALEDPLSSVTSPQAIARIMLDEAQFPAPLLRRRIVNKDDLEDATQGLLDEFVITKIAIENQGISDRFVAGQ